MAGVVVAWSGGKDSTMALHELRRDGVPIVGLYTTVNEAHDRSTMHGVRRTLHRQQAAALDLPIALVDLPPEPSNDVYEGIMARELRRYRGAGVESVVFADIFLEDVRAYREDMLEGGGLEGRWPLWGGNTDKLARAFVDAGFQAIVVAADATIFDEGDAGRPYDEAFLDDLPAGVDPCGEHGSFHTFVHNGPGFGSPVDVTVGETVTRPVGDGTFHYADLLPAGTC